MKALKKVFLALSLCLVFLLAACGQNAVPEDALEPQLDLRVIELSRFLIRDSIFDKLPTTFCDRYYPICEREDPRLAEIVQELNPCIKCNLVVNVTEAVKVNVGLVMPELGQTPEQFGKALKVDLLDSTGKVVLAQGQPNLKAPVHEFSATLNKGSYMVRVQVLDANVAKLIQASPSRYPLNFIVKAVK